MNRSIKNSIIALIVGTILLNVLMWIFGLLPSVLKAIGSGFSWLWGLAWTSIPTPLWVLAFFLVCTLRWLKARFSPQDVDENDEAEDRSPPEEIQTLSHLESELMRALAQQDGAPLSLEVFCNRVTQKRLRVRATAESLMGKGFVKEERPDILGPSIGLTHLGRDFVLQHGMV